MPVFRHELSGDPDNPVVLFADDLPLLDESIAASSMHGTIGKLTVGTYLREVTKAMAERGGFDADGRFALFADNTRCRNFVNSLLNRRGAKRRSRKFGWLVTHTTDERAIDLTLIALGSLTSQRFDLGLAVGQRPFERDGWRVKSPEQRRREREAAPASAKAEDAFVRDTGRYWRIPYEPYMPPRTSDVRWLVRIVAALLAAGKPPSVVLPIRLAGCTAARLGEILDASAWGWWKASRLGGEILLRNKCRGDEPRKRANIVAGELRALELYFDGWRREKCLRGYTMAKLRALGARADRGGKAGRAAERELRSIRLFINRDGAPMTYDNLVVTHLAPVLRVAGIPATAHWIRHEYVHRRLREIDAAFLRHQDVTLRDAERQDLADYMGWASGTAMFEVYDAFWRRDNAHRGAAAASKRLMDEVDGKSVETAVAGVDDDDRDDCGDLADFMSCIGAAANDDFDFSAAC